MTNYSGSGSRTIGIRPATNVFHALRYADTIGRSPNTFITINFTDLGLSEDDGVCRFFSEVRARISRAWKHQREGRGLKIGSLDYVGAHEAPENIHHVHWLVHVPAIVRPWFERTLTGLLMKMTGLSDLGSALQFKEINAVGGLAKYILKGVRPDAAAYFHMDACDQGVIHGRRTFVSRTLSFKARKAASWIRKRRPKGSPQRRSSNGPHDRGAHLRSPPLRRGTSADTSNLKQKDGVPLP